MFAPIVTVLLAQLPQLHWSDEYFPQANKFIPERWIPGESPFPPVQDFTFYPFSAGTRNCVGKNYAMYAFIIFIFLCSPCIISFLLPVPNPSLLLLHVVARCCLLYFCGLQAALTGSLKHPFSLSLVPSTFNIGWR